MYAIEDVCMRDEVKNEMNDSYQMVLMTAPTYMILMLALDFGWLKPTSDNNNKAAYDSHHGIAMAVKGRHVSN